MPDALLRATVTTDADAGQPCQVLIDGADTAVTANGLPNYSPTSGDRVLVTSVTNTLEIVSVLITNNPPATAVSLQAYGDAGGITLVSTGIDNGTVIDYYVNGQLSTEPQAQATRATVVRLTLDDQGNPFVAGTNYTFTAIAKNAVSGEAAPVSAAVTAQLNQGVSREFVAAQIVAGYILAGTIQVGSDITIDPNSGITINTTNPDGTTGTIQFPADGSPAQITALLNAYHLFVQDNMTILGNNNVLSGTLTIQAAWSAPVTPPHLRCTLVPAGSVLPNWPQDGITAGFGEYDSTRWWVLQGWTNVQGGNLWYVDKTTNAMTSDANFETWLANVNQSVITFRGFAWDGTYWHCLYQTVSGSVDTFWMQKIDSNWNNVGARVQVGAVTSPVHNDHYLTFDGTWLLWSHCYGGSGVTTGTITRLSPSTYNIADTATVPAGVVDSGTAPFAIGGNFDYGGYRIVTMQANKYGTGATPKVFTYPATTGNPLVATSGTTFPLMGSAVSVAWDSAANRMAAICDDGQGDWWGSVNINSYSSNTADIAGFSVANTLYDSVGTTHETTASPTSSITWKARTFLDVSCGSALLPSPGVDDPNSVRIYGTNGGTTKLATTSAFVGGLPVAGQTEYYFNSWADFSSPTTPPVTNNFPANPKDIVSQAVDTLGNPSLQFNGDGSYRLGGRDLDNYCVSLRRNAAQTLTANGTTVISFDTADMNYGGGTITLPATTLTVPRAGLYEVNVGAAITDASSTTMWMCTITAGSGAVQTIYRGPGAPNSPSTTRGTVILPLVANDTLSVSIFTTGSGFTTYGGTQYRTEMTVRWLKPAA